MNAVLHFEYNGLNIKTYFCKSNILVRIHLYNSIVTFIIRQYWTLKCHIMKVINASIVRPTHSST